ncbi:MAG: alpha-ketoacid dehydrogenase subunit alpha/beta [Bacteroidia bacterium]
MTEATISTEVLLWAYERMAWVYYMAQLYDENRELCKYVHSTSRGHEAIQLAVSSFLTSEDYVYPYYRDESMLLGMGFTPLDLMLQLLAKKEDPFSGGRTYYSHPSWCGENKPKIPHQSSATGMQAIPATGAAHGLRYLREMGLLEGNSIVVCSLGDGALTEGEVSEAFQMAVLKSLPILYVIQDNGWAISASKEEIRAMDAPAYARGFPLLKVYEVKKGWDFGACLEITRQAVHYVRDSYAPALLYARVPLLGHHTSGVRREWYRLAEEYKETQKKDPYFHLRHKLVKLFSLEEVEAWEAKAQAYVQSCFEKALRSEEPAAESLHAHVYAPTPITQERGQRAPKGAPEVLMVDAALHAVEEILAKHPEALFYGQDVGRRLGGVFREAATLAEKFGDHRVFNTPIQEAYIIGSGAGMSAVGCKPIVEIQFADYIWPGLNQLFTELSRSCYLTMGKWPVSVVIRVPTGAYGGGGPYHSSSVESVLAQIRGIKVVYPSNAADMKGLLKAAFYDPNPVVILEHKGLYWSKMPGTKGAKTPEPDAEYVVPIGKARWVKEAMEGVLILTYGMGVWWAVSAVSELSTVGIVDLRSLVPYDWAAIEAGVKKYHRVLLLTEEPEMYSFMQALAGRIAQELFRFLDAPPVVVGSAEVPAVPLNLGLEKAYLPNQEVLKEKIAYLLAY